MYYQYIVYNKYGTRNSGSGKLLKPEPKPQKFTEATGTGTGIPVVH